eukprot:SAG22_NODE_5810_length_948_cov_80.530035_1_plen_64_part_10
MEPRRPRKAPLIHNDHYASNPTAFNAVALMQHRLKAMGAVAPAAAAPGLGPMLGRAPAAARAGG